MLNWLKGLFGNTAVVKGSGSAFAKLAVNEAKELELKGKVIALNLAHEAKKKVIAELATATNVIHEESGKLSAQLAEIDAAL